MEEDIYDSSESERQEEKEKSALEADLQQIESNINRRNEKYCSVKKCQLLVGYVRYTPITEVSIFN